MPEINKANRQVCDLQIYDYKTKIPFLFFDTANVTTVGLSGDSVYAMAKGSRRIAFQNPMSGTLTVECQVFPFKFFSLFSDGVIDNVATFAKHVKVTAAVGGTLTFTVGNGEEIKSGTVYVFPAGEYGNEEAMIGGTYADGTFTATTASDIEQDASYEVGYLITKTGARKISFTNRKLPKDVFITMDTLDKDEDGAFIPFVMTAYKASIQRNWEMSFNSEGDPQSITATFDLMEDSDGNILDLVEYDDTAKMSVSRNSLTIAQGAASPDISIGAAVAPITVAIKDNADATYAKLHAVISGDSDTIIITADDDAAVATGYKVILTDSAATPQTATITVAVIAGE